MITKVLSVGGSIIAPDKPDVSLLKNFTSMAISWLKANEDSRLILVAGGGGPARTYQKRLPVVLQARKKPITHVTGSESWQPA